MKMAGVSAASFLNPAFRGMQARLQSVERRSFAYRDRQLTSTTKCCGFTPRNIETISGK
jgi:hypothetical protein